MNTLTKTFLALTIVLTSFSCSKSDDVATPISYAEENPMPTFLQNSGFNFSRATTSFGIPNFESGFSFIPKVKGKMKAIVAKLHIANPNLRVTLWDKATGTVIATNNMNIASAGVEVSMPISEISLQKDKEYVFSIKSDYFYQYQKVNLANQVYPVTAGNIQITGCLDGDNNMPNLLISNSFLGDYSFIFQQTE